MATIYFNSNVSSTKPFPKAQYKGEISFLRNPQKLTFEEAMNIVLYNYDPSLTDDSLLDFVEAVCGNGSWKATQNPQNNGISIIGVENIEEI